MAAFKLVLRRLRREPLTPAAMATVLALAIGASTAVFTVVRVTALDPGPFPDADRLVALAAAGPSWSVPMLEAYTAVNTAFDRLAGVHERAASVDTGSGAAIVRLEAVSTDYFALLGVRARVGRLWAHAEDTDRDDGAVALISHELWQRKYDADPAVTDRDVAVEGTSMRILGVLPPGFRGLIGRTDIWIPLRSTRRLSDTLHPERPFSRWFELIGRLDPELQPQVARARYEVEVRQALESLPGSRTGLGANWHPAMTPLAAARRDPRVVRASVALLAAVGLVLLLAALNLAALQVARASARAHEVAIRTALGASAAHLMAIMMGEVLVIAAAGATGGLVLRGWFLDGLLALRPPPTTFGLRSAELLDERALALDPTVVVFLLGCVLLSVVALAAAPFRQAIRPAADSALRSAGAARASLAGLRRPGARGVLVVAQLSLSIAVLAGAGLMMRTAWNLAGQDRGFETSDVFAFDLRPAEARYDHVSVREVFVGAAGQVAALPGVEEASVASCAPGVGRCRRTSVRQVDDKVFDPARSTTVGVHFSTPSHFRLLHAPLLRGRGFDSGDRQGALPVIVVSDSAARLFWPDQDPIGRRLALHFADGTNTGPRTVVGVAGNIQYNAIERAPVPDVYFPAAQVAWTSGVLFVRSQLPLDSLERAVAVEMARLAPHVALQRGTTLGAKVEAGVATERFVGVTLTLFAAAALLLAGLGVYALVADVVRSGQRECGIRLALGATDRQVLRLIVGRAAGLVAVSTVAGGAAALSIGRLLSTLLYGVAPADWFTLGGVTAIVWITALAASWIPARQALRGDPVRSLRHPA